MHCSQRPFSLKPHIKFEFDLVKYAYLFHDLVLKTNRISEFKYGTNEMLALLQQLLTYEGYYDEHLEWIGIENIQFIGSMSVQVYRFFPATSTFVLKLEKSRITSSRERRSERNGV